MSDFYSTTSPDVQPVGPAGIPRVTVRPNGAGGPKTDPFADYPTSPPNQTTAPEGKGGDPFADYPTAPPESTGKPQRQIGAGEAALLGAGHGLTAGLGPAIAGLAEAAGPDWQEKDIYGDMGNPIAPFVGAAKMVHSYFSDHPDEEVRAAYDRGRQAALEDERAAQEQHGAAFLAGQLAGTVMVPGMGALKAGTLAERVGQGMIQGGAYGGAEGAGSSVSRGESLPQIATEGAKGAAIGGAAGGAIIGAVGPRAVKALSPGQSAAQTAVNLGAPIPRGLASDSPAINATTAKMRSIPVVGSRISSAVDRTQSAAGKAVEGVADEMGGAPRAVADAIARPGLQGVIDANRQAQTAAYNGVRSQIDRNQAFTMPRTKAALDEIVAARRAAGHANPEQGLEQFRNVSQGATFEGAHRARVDAREAGNPLVPNPGYNAGDFSRLTRAMTADIRHMVHASAKAHPDKAVRDFDAAEREFGNLADQNRLLNQIVNSHGEAAIAKLLSATKEKGGDLRLLAQLRRSMPAQDFETIGGTLLNEIGHNTSTGEFSLAKFATEWEKISDGGKHVLFSPQHLANLNEIAALGRHIKGALRESNTSHTAGALILLDLARDAAVLAIGVGTGAVSGVSAVTGGIAAAPGIILAHWLASPAKTATLAAWSRSYRAAIASPTPGRVAALKIASRNLATNLSLPIQKVMDAVQTRTTAQEDVNPDQGKVTVPGPMRQ